MARIQAGSWWYHVAAVCRTSVDASITSVLTSSPLHYWHCRHTMRRGSMQLSGVRPSVCPSTGPQQQTRCCRFAAVGPAGRRYRLIAAAAACGGGNHPRMRAVTRCQRTWKLNRDLLLDFVTFDPPSTPPRKKSLSRISVPVTVLPCPCP